LSRKFHSESFKYISAILQSKMNAAAPALQPQDVHRVVFNAGLLVLWRRIQRRRRRPQRRPRSCWTRNWLTRRIEFGWYHNLMVELELEDAPTFKNFLRVDVALYREILEAVTPAIRPIGCNYRDPLPPGIKLAMTLRYFAAGGGYATIAYGFRVAPNTVHYAIKAVSQAIVDVYKVQVLTPPSTAEGWRQIADKFSSRWQFHHTLGAIDGKHIAMKKPAKSGSLFYNYKGFFSIVLLAICDADYKFIWVDVGAQGSGSDAQIFNNIDLIEAIEDNWMDIPQPEPLRHDDRDTPYFFIGDDAFPLKTWMMKPFSRRALTRPERIFNYRLSRARRVVENAFGILANRFRCLLGRLYQKPNLAVQMVMAMLCLHNVMRARYPGLQNAALDAEGEDHVHIPGQWRDDVPLGDLQPMRAPNTGNRVAKEQRVTLEQYYNHPVGAVPWQHKVI